MYLSTSKSLLHYFLFRLWPWQCQVSPEILRQSSCPSHGLSAQSAGGPLCPVGPSPGTCHACSLLKYQAKGGSPRRSPLCQNLRAPAGPQSKEVPSTVVPPLAHNDTPLHPIAPRTPPAPPRATHLMVAKGSSKCSASEPGGNGEPLTKDRLGKAGGKPQRTARMERLTHPERA